jgi:DNA repair exonuclease SbcCD ATPase subunit
MITETEPKGWADLEAEYQSLTGRTAERPVWDFIGKLVALVRRLESALSAAQGECEALKAEVEETRQAAYRIQDEYNKAQAPLQLNHAAEVFIDRFVNDPPENYWSHNIVRDGEQFEIVVQRRNGLTPAQKNEKAEQRIAELEREVEQQRADFEQRKAAFIQQQNELIVELAEERGGGVHCNDCGSYDIRPDAPTQQEATNGD